MESSSRAIHSFVRLVQAELCGRESCDESTRMHIELALEEALANALYHGNLEMSSQLHERNDAKFYALAQRRRYQSPYRNRHIEVELTFMDDRAVIAIRDEGPGFDATAIPDPCDPANLNRENGRGVFLMRSVMDHVTFNERGNEVRMVKYFKRRRR